MKILSALLLSASIIASSSAFGQIFWTENFETGAATGLQVSSYSSSNGAWSLAITGTEGADPNMWYVSCQEAGQLAGTCGNTCSASPGLGASLHIGSNSAWLGDNGASYDAGGLCGIVACPQTDRRATSPTINCTGKSNIRLKFYYLLNGQGSIDDGSVYYSPDNGVTWSLLLTPPKTTVCPSTQGRWDTIGVTLPASANNNAAVRIGFRWVNNDDGVGTDPSFAVDSVSLRTPVSVGPPVASMTVSATTVCQDSCITVTNTSTGTVDSARWSCPGTTITTTSTSPATICFPLAGVKTVKLYLYVGGIKVDSASTSITVNPTPHPTVTKTGSTYSVPALYASYQWYTVSIPPIPITGATNATYTTTVTGTYAVLVDSAGCKNFAIYGAGSAIEDIDQVTGNNFWVSGLNSGGCMLHAAQALGQPAQVTVFDVTGRRVHTAVWEKGASVYSVQGLYLAPGTYIIQIATERSRAVIKWQNN